MTTARGPIKCPICHSLLTIELSDAGGDSIPDAPLTLAVALGWLAMLGAYYWLGPPRRARRPRRP